MSVLSPTAWREAGDKLFTLPRSLEKPVEIDPHIECNRTSARRVQTTNQDPDDTAIGGDRSMLFWAQLASGQITMCKLDGWRSLNERPSNQTIDLTA